jgi:predicted esterase
MAAISTSNILADPSGRQVMAENSLQLAAEVPRTPISFAHGAADELVNVATVDATVGRYCALGVPVQYSRLPGANHALSGVAAPNVVGYLADRFAGVPAPRTC